jgi:Secretion system C-terminal sorting domain
MSKTITLMALCLFFPAALFSQIDPFSDFKTKIATEKTTNVYFAQAADSIDIITQYDAACNPLTTLKSKWSFQDKKLLYQEKDSFSYTMVGNVVKPESKTLSLWHFAKQQWVGQTRFFFTYPNNNPNLVERTTSSFDTIKRLWIKQKVEGFLLDRKGNTLAYENYDPSGLSKNLLHKIAYEYTTWGALSYVKSERPSNGNWRTDSIKTITYDAYRNRIATATTIYNYDKFDSLLNDNTQIDSVFNTYKNGLLVYRKIAAKSPLIDSFFYNNRGVLLLKKSFKTDLSGNMDTTNVYSTHYEDSNGKSLIQKNVYRRMLKGVNALTNKDTSYWVISYSELYTLNTLNQIATIRFVASDPQYNYATLYSKVAYKYCGDISLPAEEIQENLAFSISPNPTNQTLYVHIEAQNDLKSSIQILDVLGNILQQKDNEYGDLKQIDVSNFASGVYFLKVQNGSKAGVKKFVVHR